MKFHFHIFYSKDLISSSIHGSHFIYVKYMKEYMKGESTFRHPTLAASTTASTFGLLWRGSGRNLYLE